MADRIGKPVSQRQLRVGEMIKQSLSMLKDCLIISPTLSCLCDTGFPILSAIKLTSQ